MKTLMCSLAAILSVALSSAVFAISDDGEITGTIVSMTKGGDVVLDDGKGKYEFVIACECPTPKVGEKVRMEYYHCGSGRKGFHHCVKKVEKLGDTEKSAPKK